MKKLFYLILLSCTSFTLVNAQSVTIDQTFKRDFDFKNSDIINCVLLQPDGKILVGGEFELSLFGGKHFNNILRLNTDGSLDQSFKLTTFMQGKVNSIILQNDGKIIVGGEFLSENNNIIRLDKNGKFDSSYRPNYLTSVFKLAVQKDNKIIVAGKNLDNKISLIRLDKNGNKDNKYTETLLSDTFSFGDMVILADDGLMLSYLKNKDWSFIILRIDANGSYDKSFQFESLKNELQLFGSVNCIKQQADGKIIIGGNFCSYLDFGYSSILRINADGTLDKNFNKYWGFDPFEQGLTIKTIGLQADKIIVGGRFNNFNRANTRNIVGLNNSGTFNYKFSTGDGFDQSVNYVIPLDEGKIIVAGNFTSFNTILTNRITRLNTKDNINLNYSISPNPSSGKFRIDASQTINLLTLTDAMGREILNIAPMSSYVEINLEKESSGIYFVKFLSRDGIKIETILKK